MKNLKLFLFILFPMVMLAQQKSHNAMEKFTPLQKATLKAKEMRLHLDLTDRQEAQVVSLFRQALENQPVKPKQPQDLTQKERYDMRLAKLEVRVQLQEKMQDILNDEQYAKWKEMNKGLRHHRGKKRVQNNNRRGRQHGHKIRTNSGYQKS